jgi:hypothetical protein
VSLGHSLHAGSIELWLGPIVTALAVAGLAASLVAVLNTQAARRVPCNQPNCDAPGATAQRNRSEAAMIVSLGIALTFVLGQVDRDAAVTRELTRIEQQLATSWKNGDCDGWGALVDREWSVIHITGTVMTKAQALQMCRAPEARIDTFTIDDLSVRVFENAAVVTGRTTVSMGGAKTETVRLRFTDVFIRRGGRWQIVASHATRLGAS